MAFLESLAAQLNEPTMLEGLRNRGAVAGIGDSGTMISSLAPDQKARYAANVARRLGTPAVVPVEPAAGGKGADSEARYASNVARRLVTPTAVSAENGTAGAGVDPEVRFAANAASQLATPAALWAESVAAGAGAGPEARYAANVARPLVRPAAMRIESGSPGSVAGRTGDQINAGVADVAGAAAPPMVTGPSMDAVQSAISDATRGYMPGVTPDVYGVGGPDLSTAPLPWRDPALIRRQYGIPDDPQPAVPQAGHGFLAHLKGLMEGLGAGLSTGHPLAGAIMGVAGGVKPQLGANAWYNNVTLPRWQGQQDQALDRAAKRLGIGKSIADMTGIDPFSGGQTYEAQQAQVKADQQDRIAQALAEHRKQMEDIARLRENDMNEVRRGNLDIKEALKQERIRNDEAMEKLRQQLLQIQKQNADANTLRANKLGQPRTTTTTKILGPNPDHPTWEHERDAALAKNPGASVTDLIKEKLLRKEPPAQIQTGTRTTRRAATGASAKA